MANKPQPFKCLKCGKTYKVAEDLIHHLVADEDVPLEYVTQFGTNITPSSVVRYKVAIVQAVRGAK